MTTCIRKCKFWASFIWEKKRILFGFFIDVFWKRGRERERKEREGGVVQQVVAIEKRWREVFYNFSILCLVKRCHVLKTKFGWGGRERVVKK